MNSRPCVVRVPSCPVWDSDVCRSDQSIRINCSTLIAIVLHAFRRAIGMAPLYLLLGMFLLWLCGGFSHLSQGVLSHGMFSSLGPDDVASFLLMHGGLRSRAPWLPIGSFWTVPVADLFSACHW